MRIFTLKLELHLGLDMNIAASRCRGEVAKQCLHSHLSIDDAKTMRREWLHLNISNMDPNDANGAWPIKRVLKHQWVGTMHVQKADQFLSSKPIAS